MVKRAVITGATGMIGIALSKNLIGKGYEVIAVIRPNSSRKSHMPVSPMLKVVELDANEIASLPQVLKSQNLADNVELFFHLAWSGTTAPDRNNMELQLKNISNSVSAVTAAGELGCKAFLGAGSQAEYGRVTGGVKLSAYIPCFPENGYGSAKLCACNLTRIRAEQLGIKHVWVRILSIYGPWDTERSLIMSAIRTMANNEKFSCTKGEQKWDYLHADDAAEALSLALIKGKHGSIYPVGSGKIRLLSEYITDIRDRINPSLDIGFGDIEYFPGQVMYLCADISDLTYDTGFEPKISFEKGIEDTINWYRGING